MRFLRQQQQQQHQQPHHYFNSPSPSRHEEFHNNLVMGLAVRRGDDDPGDRSGYQPIRLATELFPALVAVIGAGELSPFWAVLFYFSLVAFGIAQQVPYFYLFFYFCFYTFSFITDKKRLFLIAFCLLLLWTLKQQLAIWHCVISGIVAFRSCCLKSWETTITFCTCLLGFAASLPLATEVFLQLTESC